MDEGASKLEQEDLESEEDNFAYRIITAWGQKKKREVTIRLQTVYVVDPLNPRKLRHRGRQCVVIGEPENHYGTFPVRFLDNNRRGRVDGGDLVALADYQA